MRFETFSQIHDLYVRVNRLLKERKLKPVNVKSLQAVPVLDTLLESN